MITAEPSQKTLDQIADEIALRIVDGPNSEIALHASHHTKIVNAGIVEAGQVHNPELRQLHGLVSKKVKELLR